MPTCRACDVEPYAYVRHGLTDLPRRQPRDDVSYLLPFNFNKNRIDCTLTNDWKAVCESPGYDVCGPWSLE